MADGALPGYMGAPPPRNVVPASLEKRLESQEKEEGGAAAVEKGTADAPEEAPKAEEPQPPKQEVHYTSYQVDSAAKEDEYKRRALEREAERLRAREARKAEVIMKCIERFLSHNPQKGRNKKEKLKFREALMILFEDISRKVYVLKRATLGDCYNAMSRMSDSEKKYFNAICRLVGKKTLAFKKMDEKQMAVFYSLSLASEAVTYKLDRYPNVHNVKVDSLRQRGFGAPRMYGEFGFSAKELRGGGYDEVDLLDARMRPLHLHQGGLSLEMVRETTQGFLNGLSQSEAKELRDADFSIAELRDSGTQAWDLYLGNSEAEADLVAAGYRQGEQTATHLQRQGMWTSAEYLHPTSRPRLSAAVASKLNAPEAWHEDSAIRARLARLAKEGPDGRAHVRLPMRMVVTSFDEWGREYPRVAHRYPPPSLRVDGN